MVCGSDGQLSVTVIEARAIPWRKEDASIYVEVFLLPGGSTGKTERLRSESRSVLDSEFNDTFSL